VTDAPTRRRPASAGIDLDELAALEEQRAFLLRSLDDLDREHDAGDLDDDDYATLRTDYTARAAEVLHAIDDRRTVIDDAQPTQRGVRRVLLVAAVAIVAVVAGLVVTSTSGGRSTSGSDGGQDLKASKATQACVDEMTKAFAPAANGKANPEMGTQAIATIRCFSNRIDAEPTDAVAYTYRGWTLALLARQLGGAIPTADVAQFVQRARTDLAEARKLAPRYPDALAFSAINALWSQDLATATRELAVLDSLQLPADTPVLGYVDGMLRPALRAAEAASSSTTVPSGSSSTTPSGAVPSTTAP
jgi:hypothetical protein